MYYVKGLAKGQGISWTLGNYGLGSMESPLELRGDLC